MRVEITKRDDELRVVWGWASIIEKGGTPVVDAQGDVISEGELVNAAHEFTKSSRVGGFMHARNAHGSAVRASGAVRIPRRARPDSPLRAQGLD